MLRTWAISGDPAEIDTLRARPQLCRQRFDSRRDSAHVGRTIERVCLRKPDRHQIVGFGGRIAGCQSRIVHLLKDAARETVRAISSGKEVSRQVEENRRCEAHRVEAVERAAMTGDQRSPILGAKRTLDGG